jgi:aromatic ring-opening dioxygenase catalytic subunit (LigB family)
MGAFLSQNAGVTDAENEAFEDWLVDTCSNSNVPPRERERRLIEWADAPAARYCHPREEHLLPLHVCCGLSNSAAALVFDDKVIGKRTTAYLW